MTAEKLRKSILQYAIEGKLVPQDPTDEPASKLLEKVREERAKLISEKKVKPDKNESYIFQADEGKYYEKFANGRIVDISEDIPFEIPSSWSWCRLGEICLLQDGEKKDGKFPYLDAKHFRGKGTDIADSGKYVSANNYVILVDGENSGEVFYTEIEGYQGSTFKILNISRFVDDMYILFLIRKEHDLLKKTKVGSAIPHLNKKLFRELFVALPPLAEQKRIVEKLEELLPKVADFEKVEKELNLIEKKFPIDFRKSILQYAIEGKLVPQDSADEPASKLLEKVRAERQAKVETGEIKRDKNESYIYKNASDNCYYEKFADGREVDITNEIPFEIPPSWSWCRLGNIIDFNLGKTPARDKSIYWQNDFPWVSISDMVENGIVRATKERVSNYALENIFKGRFSKKGTLLMSFKLTVGRVSILDIDAVHNEAIISIYPKYDNNNNMQKYLFNMLPYITASIDKKEAIKGKTLNKESISKILIPLPPLAEQKRIVAKLEDVFKYLDQIQSNLI